MIQKTESKSSWKQMYPKSNEP